MLMFVTMAFVSHLERAEVTVKKIVKMYHGILKSALIALTIWQKVVFVKVVHQANTNICPYPTVAL